MKRIETKPTKIRCSKCRKGKLRLRRIDHNVGPLLDLPRVWVENMPALVCPSCEAVSIIGLILDEIAMRVAVEILQLSSLPPIEVRFLRKLLGDTQDEFAARLSVDRVTVNRWENGSDDVSGPTAYAIRSHAYFRLRTRSSIVDSVAASFTAEHLPSPPSKKKGYSIQASDLQAAA